MLEIEYLKSIWIPDTASPAFYISSQKDLQHGSIRRVEKFSHCGGRHGKRFKEISNTVTT